MQALMQGKRGLIMGVANDHSIAWGIARTLHAHGAELAFTYQGEALGKRFKPLASSVGAKLVLPCDVENIATVDAVFVHRDPVRVLASVVKLTEVLRLLQSVPRESRVVVTADGGSPAASVQVAGSSPYASASFSAFLLLPRM